MKRTSLVIGGVLGAAALWSGGWYAGKAFFVAPQADAAVEKVRSGATFFSFDRREISGFPFGYDVSYHNVSISDASTLWRWTAPLIRLETGLADVGAVRATLSDASVLVVEAPLLGGGPDGSPMVFDILSVGLVATLSDDEGVSQIELEADSITADQKEGESVLTGGKAALTKLSADIKAGPDSGSYLADVEADSLTLGYQFSRDGVNQSSNLSEMSGVRIDVETRALSGGDLGAILANDGMATVEFVADAYRATAATSGGPSAPPVSIVHESGETSAELSLVEGRARYSAGVSDMETRVEVQAPGPFSTLALAMKALSMTMEMPLKQAEEAQPYAIAIELDGLDLADDIWAAFDPLQKLNRDAVQMTLDITGGARVLTDFMEAQLTQAPIDLETLEISEFRLEALGAKAGATGAFDIAGDASRSNGEMDVTVEGAFALLDDLSAAGLVPAEALGAYQALIGQFAIRDGDEDRLTINIESRRGQVSINGHIVSQ